MTRAELKAKFPHASEAFIWANADDCKERLHDMSAPEDAEPRERDLHDKIYDECQRRGWIALHGSMAHRTFRTGGEADFTIIADHGRVFFVEAKSKTGKLSPAQLAMKRHAEKLGHHIYTVRSMTEFMLLVPEMTEQRPHHD